MKDWSGDGILFTNGVKWQFQRKQASYIFSDVNLKEVMFPVMKKNADKIISKRTTLSKEDSYDMQKVFLDIFMDSLLEIVSWNSSLFDTDSDFGSNHDKFVSLLVKRFANSLWRLQR